MGDGWETKRNRTPGNRDWVIVRLAHEGSIEKIMIDTCYFKGNYPDSCVVEGCNISLNEENKLNDPEINPIDIGWTTILTQSKLEADHEHFFEKVNSASASFTHVRLSIFPDGGISRMRIWGRIKK